MHGHVCCSLGTTKSCKKKRKLRNSQGGSRKRTYFTSFLQAWELSAKMQISAAVKLTFCGEKKMFVGKRNWWYKKINKINKKEASVLVLHWIPTKHTECVHMWLSPVLVVNCEHSQLLSLSWAGDRLHCSHSYLLLHYVSAKKKWMLQKFLKVNWGWGWEGLDLRVFFQTGSHACFKSNQSLLFLNIQSIKTKIFFWHMGSRLNKLKRKRNIYISPTTLFFSILNFCCFSKWFFLFACVLCCP